MRGTLLFRYVSGDSRVVSVHGVLRMPRGTIHPEQLYSLSNNGKATQVGTNEKDLGYLTMSSILRLPLFFVHDSKILYFRKVPGKDLDTPEEEAFLVAGVMPFPEELGQEELELGALVDITPTSQTPVVLDWEPFGQSINTLFNQNLYLEERWCIPTTMREDCILQLMRGRELIAYPDLQKAEFAGALTQELEQEGLYPSNPEFEAYLERRIQMFGNSWGTFPMSKKDKELLEQQVEFVFL